MPQSFRFRHLHRIVGLFVLAAVGALLAGVLLVGKASHWFERALTVEVAFGADTLGLLRPGMPVKVLGSEAGQLLDAHLDGPDRVLALVRVREDFRRALRADAYAVIHTPVAGLLGESFVEIWPGQATAALSDGARLPSKDKEDLMSLARATVERFGAMADEIRGTLSDNRQELSAAIINLRRMSEAVAAIAEDNRALVKDSLTRVESMSREVAAMVAENRTNVKATTEQLPTIAGNAAAATASVAAAAGEVHDTVAENRDDLRAATANVRALSAKVDSLSVDLARITAQIADGKGTAGKLVMDDTLHEKAVKTADNINARIDEVKPMTEGLSALRLYAGIDGGYNTKSGSGTGTAYLMLEPRPWKFYLGGISYRSAPTDRAAPADKPNGLPVDFTLLLGWRFFPKAVGDDYGLAFGVGMIETRLGGVIDAPVFTERFHLRALLRGKHNSRDPLDRRYEDGTALLRLTGNIRLWERVVITGGIDDVIDHRAPWIGLRAELLDNDLRNLTSLSGIMH